MSFWLLGNFFLACTVDNVYEIFFFVDFELQAGLVELIFHLIPEMVRQDKAHVYFSNSSVAQAFMDIKSSEFEAVSRIKICCNLNRMYTSEMILIYDKICDISVPLQK